MAALAAGAVDFIDKSTFNVMDLEFLRREVVDRMQALAPGNGASRQRRSCAGHRGPRSAGPAPPLRPLRDRRLHRRAFRGSADPGAAARPISATHRGGAAHAGGFHRGFRESVCDALSRLRVSEAVEGMRLAPGQRRVAPGGRHVRISSGLAVVLTSEPSEARHIPSIDVTMRSAARSRPGRVSDSLTGWARMGRTAWPRSCGRGVTIAWQ